MIESHLLKIRPIKEKDLDVLYALLEQSILKNEFFPKNIESEYKFKRNFLENGLWDENDASTIITNLKDEIIGMITYQRAALIDALEIKYIIFNEKNRGRGFMKEALNLFSKYLFSTKQINRLQLAIPDYHRASIAVAQKCGYIFEGIARGALFSKGSYLDLCIYSMLRDESKNIDKLF
ncbi:MAG: putative ribosomal N-acetyltransferase YdaF [Candidatus Anoxychlamydiales bacterium]|nr:putative ribosomal N-acetyltransferase YdaF [Candidatus Anoxychlamydiales bacterium]